MVIQQIPAKIKGVADIVFCVDITGSMEPCIDGVKANIEAFASSIKSFAANVQVDWRARAVGYRDFNEDTEYLVNHLDFVSTPEEVKNQLTQIHADGGGDEPESTLDAILYATLKSNWRPQCHKIIVVFTDAPTLPNLSAVTMSDLSHPDGLDTFYQTIVENRIKLFIYGPSDPIFEELGKKKRIKFEAIPTAGDGLKAVDLKKLMDTIGKTVSQIASAGIEK